MFPSSSILTMKIVLMSSGVVSLAWAVKHTLIPLIVHFTLSDLPTVWSVFLLMFKPPYLYVLFNGIIITVYAISRSTQNQTHLSSPQLIPCPIPVQDEITHDIIVPPPATLVVEELVIPAEVWDEKTAVVVDGLEVEGEEEKEVVEEVEEVVQDMAPETELVEPATEKPLELAAFPAHKYSNLNPEGRRSNKGRVTTKHQRHETLDNTWRMITQGRHSTDTFSNFEKHNLKSSVPENSLFRKSATFKDRTNFLHEPLVVSKGIVRKESSLDKEELNRQVEAFIRKFNEDMRLQRQDSYNRYLEMINHG